MRLILDIFYGQQISLVFKECLEKWSSLPVKVCAGTTKSAGIWLIHELESGIQFMALMVLAGFALKESMRLRTDWQDSTAFDYGNVFHADLDSDGHSL